MFPGQRAVIACCPEDIAKIKLDLPPGLPHPVTIEHTLVECSGCQGKCWIGPKQKLMADSGIGEILCYRCLAKDPDYQSGMPMISVNPDIDDVPRRFT